MMQRSSVLDYLALKTETIVYPARLNGNMPVVRAQPHLLFLVRRLMPNLLYSARFETGLPKNV